MKGDVHILGGAYLGQLNIYMYRENIVMGSHGILGFCKGKWDKIWMSICGVESRFVE